VLALDPGLGAAQESAAGRVADLASKALAAPLDSSSWAALARALPELALSGGAELEETFEAARLADSVAFSIRPAPAQGLAMGLGPRRPAEVSTAGLTDVFPTGWAVLTVVAAGLGALVFLRRRARRALRPLRLQGAGKGRVRTARALARGGAGVADIARRTGMAREAVSLALRVRGPGDRKVA
jgi:hypothetical protein